MVTDRPKMCPRCRKLVGLDRICPYCGADTSSLVNRARQVGGGIGSHGHAVTIGLVVANLLAYLLIVLVGGQQPAEGGMELFVPDRVTLVRLGLQVPVLVSEGEWWRLVMPIFLHLGLLHLAMNTLVLWVTGRQIESDIGSFAFFFMYIASGIVGFVASQFMEIPGGGASGAVAGILGCTIVKRRISDGHFRDPVTQQAIQLVVLNALFGLIVARVNNVAHLGGLLTGAGLGAAYGLWQGRRWASRLWLGGAIASALVVVLSVVAMLRWEPPPGFFDPADRRVRAAQALSCAREVAMALDNELTTIAPKDAEAAMRCIDAVGPIEPELDRAMATLRSGLQRAYEGRTGGSVGGEREGMMRIGEGLEALMRWHKVNFGSE